MIRSLRKSVTFRLRFPQPEIHTSVKEIWGWERPPTSGGIRDNPEGHTYGDWRRTNSQTRECLSEAEWLLPSLQSLEGRRSCRSSLQAGQTPDNSETGLGEGQQQSTISF